MAGGTWLAVDPTGRIGAVTNRHPGGVVPARDAARRTRGTLPLDALAGSDADAHAWMTSLEPGDYNPVNVLYASPTAAFWTSLDDDRGRRTTTLTPGIHVLAEQDVDDPADPKARNIRGQAAAALEASPDAGTLVSRLREVLRSHEAPEGGLPACIHGELPRHRLQRHGHGRPPAASASTTPKGRPAPLPSKPSSDGTNGAICPILWHRCSMGRLVDRRRMTRMRDGTATEVVDQLAVEEPLTLRVNGVDVATTMRTPGHDIELALGGSSPRASCADRRTSSAPSRVTPAPSRCGSPQSSTHRHRG